VTTEADIDFSSLPQVDQTARPPVKRRPRFDGDVSAADVSSWVLQYRRELSVRLSERDLLRSSTAPTSRSLNRLGTNLPRGIKLLRHEMRATANRVPAEE
jgi:hypothetical protein